LARYARASAWTNAIFEQRGKDNTRVKGLILSGGKGTRLRPLTYTGAKQLVPVANKPVLFYAIEDLVEAGITDIGIVVGDTADQIMAAVGDGQQFGCRITYIRQDQPRGIAHGVLIAQNFLEDDKFVLFLGDNFIREGIVPMVEEFRSSSMHAQILLHEVSNPQAFGVAVIHDGRIIAVEEKPVAPRTNLAIVGIYMFDHHVFDAIRSVKPSARGELEITDTIQRLIDDAFDVRPTVLSGWWIDTGKHSDMLDANRLILETIETRILGTVDAHSAIHGKVVLERGAELVNSVVRGPVIIGAYTRIIDAYVGPFTAINDHCVIEQSEIEHSIVMEHSSIRHISHRIEDSLIGRYVELYRTENKPRAYKMLLGDHSRVGILER